MILAHISSSSPLAYFHACFVYGPHSAREQQLFWTRIRNRLNHISSPYPVIGDFDAVGGTEDKQGGCDINRKKMEEFQSFISSSYFLDIPFNGLSYTWSNKRVGPQNVRERIDRAWLILNLWRVPEFGDWENKEDVSYTVCFEKKKKNRNSKNKPQIYYPSSDSEASFQARDEAEIKFGETAKSDPGRPKNREFRDPPKTKQESRGSQVEVDLRKSTDSPTHTKGISRQTVASDQHFDSYQMHPHHKEKARNKGSPMSSTREEVDLGKSTDSPKHTKGISRQSVGSDKSFDRSPMHPHQQEKIRNKVSNSSALGERKVSSEGSHGGAASSTPGRSRFRQVPLDENNDDSPAIPKFGDWDDNDPRTGEPYTEVFNKARKDKQAAGGKSPAITNENANFYGHRDENFKGCGCFPWGQKMISGLKSGRG